MKKHILALAISLTSAHAFANNYYNIIYSDNINYDIDSTPAPSAPTVSIFNDINNDGVLSISEISGINKVDVKVELPSSNVSEGYILKVSGQTDKVLTQSDISNGVFNYQYDIPTYGERIEVISSIEGVKDKKSKETSDSAMTQLYIDKSTLQGVTYNNTHTKLSTEGLLSNFSYEAWVKPHKMIKTGSLKSNIGIDGTSGENYVFYAEHGGTNTGQHGIGLSVGTNGYKVHIHSAAYMPAVYVNYTPVSSTEWTHFFVVVKNNVPYVYVNGSHVGTGLAPNAGIVHSSGTIGDDHGSYGELEGEVAIARIWDNSLTSAEVASIYNKYIELNNTIGSAKLVEVKNQK